MTVREERGERREEEGVVVVENDLVPGGVSAVFVLFRFFVCVFRFDQQQGTIDCESGTGNTHAGNTVHVQPTNKNISQSIRKQTIHTTKSMT